MKKLLEEVRKQVGIVEELNRDLDCRLKELEIQKLLESIKNPDDVIVNQYYTSEAK